jgi:predicted nucleotidyltransferase
VITDIPGILQILHSSGVEFVVVGGVAATAHGSARATNDLDVVYRRTPNNFGKLAAALAPHSPYLRGAPPGLPFRWDVATIERGLNFTLSTSLGAVDLLGEIAGGGSYEDLLRNSTQIEIFGARCSFLNLEKLIEVKRAAGRPKDLEVIAELEAIQEEREGK